VSSHICFLRRITIVLFMIQSTASAALIPYLDRAAWESTVSNRTEIDYEDPVAAGAAGQIMYNDVNGFSRSGIRVVGYTGSTFELRGIRASAAQPWYSWSTGAILVSQPTAGDVSVRITYTGGPTAIGLYLMTGNPYAAPVTILVNGTDSYVVQTQNNPTPTWWGIAGATPITFAEFRPSSGTTLELDVLSMGLTAPAADVAEPATFIMCAAGLLFAGRLRFRSKRR